MIITDKTFNKEVLDSEIPVLVDFWASWCPPCKMVEPVIKELAGSYDGKLKVSKINVDQNPTSAANYKIMGVPTFIIFRSGEVLTQCTGAQSRQQLEDMIKEAGIIV